MNGQFILALSLLLLRRGLAVPPHHQGSLDFLLMMPSLIRSVSLALVNGSSKWDHSATPVFTGSVALLSPVIAGVSPACASVAAFTATFSASLQSLLDWFGMLAHPCSMWISSSFRDVRSSFAQLVSYVFNHCLLHVQELSHDQWEFIWVLVLPNMLQISPIRSGRSWTLLTWVRVLDC